MLDELLLRFRQHDRRALSRLLTLAARGELTDTLTAELPAPPKPSRVVAVTGSGGVGKSTLTGKLIDLIRRENLTVAVLACDPESPLSHGALLGDRVRMAGRPEDDGVFIRSLATRGGHGAVAEHLPLMTKLLESHGFDLVIIETVGAGQGDTTARDLADVIVLLLQPESGDDLQWEKAGILEVADIVVIHKADLPGADTMAAQVEASLALSSGATTAPVVRVSSKTGAGLAELWEAVRKCPPRQERLERGGDELLRLAQESLARHFSQAKAQGDKRLNDVLRRWQREGLDTDVAIRELTAALTDV
jgi:LAO/AO transport system ATPase